MSSDMFMKIDNGAVKGESKDKTHTDEIELNAWSWGVTQPADMAFGKGGGRGRAQFGEIAVMKDLDLSSTDLAKKCSDGSHFDEVIITNRKAGGKQNEFLVVTLNKVLISSYNVSAAMGSDVLQESLSLNYEQIKIEYTTQTDEGTQGAGTKYAWNVAEHAEAV